MSLYEGAETKVKVRLSLSEEFSVKVGVHQGSVLSRSLLAMMVDEVTENANERLNEANSLCRRFDPNGGNYGRIEKEL